MASGSPERDFGPRSARRPLHPLHGRHDGHAQGRGLAPGGRVLRARRWDRPRGRHPASTARRPWSRRASRNPVQATMLPIAPLMHGATQWGVMGGSVPSATRSASSRVRARRGLEAHRGGEGQRDDDHGRRHGPASVRGARRSRGRRRSTCRRGCRCRARAALFSPSVKDAFLERFPNLILTEAIGASESGSNGYTMIVKGNTAMKGGPTVTPIMDTVVLDEDLEIVEAGSGVVGKVARRGNIPHRVLQGPGQERGDVRHCGRRRPVLDPRRLRDRRGRRHDHAARPRVGVDQLGRREDLPGGGRGGGEVPPRRVRLHRRGRARRPMGSAGRGGGPGA